MWNTNDTSGVADDSLLDTVDEGSRPVIALPDSFTPEQTTPVPTPVEGTTIPPVDTLVPPPAPASGSGANPEEDPQDFIDEMHKTLRDMRATETEGVELVAYCLKGVAYSWFELWEDSREEGRPPARWSEFADTFIDHFLPAKTRAARAAEFENLRQGNRSVWEYHMEFSRLSKYVIHMFPTMEARVRRFVQGLNYLTISEASMAALNSDMNYGKMVAFAQDTMNHKLKSRMEREGSSKAQSTGNMGESLGGGRSSFKGGS
ncbi:uncharacterized protein [Nicotiana sylvestris]|uniref:uncharacterized protein n=1 Tax=Nicotiana sylvestris TaxID=4096 RepID=UPI00388C6B80